MIVPRGAAAEPTHGSSGREFRIVTNPLSGVLVGLSKVFETEGLNVGDTYFIIKRDGLRFRNTLAPQLINSINPFIGPVVPSMLFFLSR